MLQSVAPHAGTDAGQVAADEQQCPVPDVPHLPLEQLVFPEHVAPAASLLTQVPEAPGFWQKSLDDWQSLSDEHAVLQAVPLAQMKPPGQAEGVPDTHVLNPLQTSGVSIPLLHVGPGQSPLTLHCTQPSVAVHCPVGGMHATGLGGLQAPAPLQLVAGSKTVPTQEALEQPVPPPG